MVFGTVLASFTFHPPPPAENLLLVIPFPLTVPRFPKLLSAALTHDYSLTLVIHPVAHDLFCRPTKSVFSLSCWNAFSWWSPVFLTGPLTTSTCSDLSFSALQLLWLAQVCSVFSSFSQAVFVQWERECCLTAVNDPAVERRIFNYRIWNEVWFVILCTD